MTWTGFGPLDSAEALLGKVRRDLERMKARPDDADAAFDFFVTAEHMRDWRWPDSDDPSEMAIARAARATAISSNPDLEVVAHVANQAKHFEATRYAAVRDLGRTEGDFDAADFARPDFHVGSIDIVLPGGSIIDAIDLGERVVTWWEHELGGP